MRLILGRAATRRRRCGGGGSMGAPDAVALRAPPGTDLRLRSHSNTNKRKSILYVFFSKIWYFADRVNVIYNYKKRFDIFSAVLKYFDVI